MTYLVTEQERDLRKKLRASLAVIKQLKSDVARLRSTKAEPIAILGVGCRLPGRVQTPDDYWRLLCNRVDAISEVPSDRWDAGQYFHPTPAIPGKSDSVYGGFLTDVDRFDADFFRISSREARRLDPQQRISLEVAWEALERAAIDPLSLVDSSTGVFLGICSHDYADLQLADLTQIDAYVATGNSASTCAGRISFTLGLQGPSLAVDTACSSSLVSVHLACQYLRNGECDLALAGGVHLILSPAATISFANARMLAPDGRCKAFDARANGFVRSEGCGIIVLKRLSDAVANGDPILAVIRGSAVNQDGKSSGLTVPNGPSQEAVIRTALQQAGVEPADVGYIEAHGTGTALGDPIEMNALGCVFGKGRAQSYPLRIGSVKTNLGHLEAAAGIAGLIKAVLCLQHREIPPNLHFQSLNPNIRIADMPLKVEIDGGPWKTQGRDRIAGVSSFGFCGTNAHAILTEPPEREPAFVADANEQLLVLSAQSKTGLDELCRNYDSFLASQPDLASVCHTSQLGRAHFRHRIGVVGKSTDELRGKLAKRLGERPARALATPELPAGEPPQLAFLFTGEGPRYIGAGKQLYETDPTFRRTLDECDEILKPILPVPLLPTLFPADDSHRETAVDITLFSQSLIFSLQVALATTWMSWGVKPSAVLGHSSGEYAAAWCAGVFDLEQGLKLVSERSRLMHVATEPGGLVVAFASLDAISRIVSECADVAIAAINGSSQIVISGTEPALQAVVAQFRADKVRHQHLRATRAFHSPTMRPIVERFRKTAQGIDYHTPSIDFFSTVTARLAHQEVATADYWVEHLTSSTNFVAGIRAVHQSGCRAYVEIGPEPTLLALGMDCVLEREPAIWLPSLRPRQSARRQMLESLARLYVNGTDIAWRHNHLGARVSKAANPTYPFQRQRFWFDASSTIRNGKSRDNQSESDRKPVTKPRSDVLDRLRRAPAGDRNRMLVAALREACASILGNGDVLPDPTVRFFDLGMNSLMAVELIDDLQSEFGIPLPTTVAFDLPTINELAAYLVEKLFGDSESRTDTCDAEVRAGADDNLSELGEGEIARLLATKIESLRKSGRAEG